MADAGSCRCRSGRLSAASHQAVRACLCDVGDHNALPPGALILPIVDRSEHIKCGCAKQRLPDLMSAATDDPVLGFFALTHCLDSCLDSDW